ncbi:MAG: hypothetical protein ACSHW3_14060 [Sulfitobacter sp.]
MLQKTQDDFVLVLRAFNDRAQFFVRFYNELGFATRSEFGPSLYCGFNVLAEFYGWDAAASSTDLVLIKQSDEGGRFMHSSASYHIKLVLDVPPCSQYPCGMSIGLSELEQLVARAGKTTNELGTLVSLALSWAFDTACFRL